MSIHYPVDEDHPTSRKDSLFRASICHPNRATLLSIENKKVTGPRGDQRNTKLGFNYGANGQSYFSRDESIVDCKMCKKMLNNRNLKDNPLQVRAEIDRLEKRKKLIEEKLKKLKESLSS